MEQKPWPAPRAAWVDPLRSYRAELSVEELDPRGELVDWLIGYTFDHLDAVKLTLRIASAPAPHTLRPTSTRKEGQT